MIQLKAFYLPWGMMAMTALMGGSVLPDFLGIVAAGAPYTNVQKTLHHSFEGSSH